MGSPPEFKRPKAPNARGIHSLKSVRPVPIQPPSKRPGSRAVRGADKARAREQMLLIWRGAAGTIPQLEFRSGDKGKGFALGKPRDLAADSYLPSLFPGHVRAPRLSHPDARRSRGSKRCGGRGSPQIQISVPHFPPPMWHLPSASLLFHRQRRCLRSTATEPSLLPRSTLQHRMGYLAYHFICNPSPENNRQKNESSDHVKRHGYKIH